MDFIDLIKTLGQSGHLIAKMVTCSEPMCRLPVQPIHRLKSFDGWEILSTSPTIFQIPLEDGVARIIGEMKIESDGTQTLINVLACYVPSEKTAK
jgi:hypothetical protein